MPSISIDEKPFVIVASEQPSWLALIKRERRLCRALLLFFGASKGRFTNDCFLRSCAGCRGISRQFRAATAQWHKEVEKISGGPPVTICMETTAQQKQLNKTTIRKKERCSLWEERRKKGMKKGEEKKRDFCGHAEVFVSVRGMPCLTDSRSVWRPADNLLSCSPWQHGYQQQSPWKLHVAATASNLRSRPLSGNSPQFATHWKKLSVTIGWKF